MANNPSKSKESLKKPIQPKSSKDQEGRVGDDLKSLDYCSICEKKVIPSEEAKSLKCFRCLKMFHSTCHQPPLNTELVKRF